MMVLPCSPPALLADCEYTVDQRAVLLARSLSDPHTESGRRFNRKPRGRRRNDFAFAADWLLQTSTPRLVFIDETSTKTIMAPLRGWPPKGARLPGKAPFLRPLWNTMMFLAALRWDRVAAPWLLNKPINGERFQIYVEEGLAPTLSPGDIVIMDNLGAHEAKAVRAAIQSAGAKLLFLPKYSPDLNPIEKLFAKIKHHLRKAQARSVEAVCQTIGQILATVTPQECSNDLTYAGYERT